MKTIMFITRNKEKLAIANNALKGLDIKIVGQKIDCPEIQKDDNEDIAKYSAKYASEYTKNDVIKSDSGFYIEELQGFPGPYAEYVERKLDAQDIINLMNGKENRKAYYKDVLAYCKFGNEPIIFTTYTYGTISLYVDGNYGYNFDRIFICDGDTQTMANFQQEQRIKKYSNDNWIKLYEYLKKNSHH